MSFSLITLKEKIYYKCYGVGSIILLFYALCHKLIYSEVILFIGLLIVEVGFVIWAIQFYKNNIMGRFSYTLFFGIVNLFILWLSNAYAQELVVASLGLPAEDFGLTLHLLVLLCYIPAAMVVTILLFFIVYLLLSVLLTLKMSRDIVYSFIYPFLVLCGLKKREEMVKKDNRMFLHFFAFGVTSILLASVFSFIVKYQSLLYPSIRYIAYFTDYQYIYNYPQIDKNKKIKLHANGIVSTMKGSDQSLKVVVSKLDE